MGAFSIWHWLVVLLVVVLLFGSKKLRNLGGDLGVAVRGFKQGLKSDGGALESNTEEGTMNTQETEVEKSDDRGHSA